MNASSQGNTLVFETKPQNFSPTMEVAACYLEINGKFLFLRRATGKPEGGKWGVPAGKIEQNEGSLEAVCRETFEETQIVLNQEQLTFIGKLFVSKPEVGYVYHMYHLKVDRVPDVVLNKEHEEYRWLSADEVKDFSIMSGGKEALYHFKALANKPKLASKSSYSTPRGNADVNSNLQSNLGFSSGRTGTNVNAYLILKKKDRILLHLRKNTGYLDGCYGLVSGHIEDGESVLQGLKREAFEEAGIEIADSDLRFVHCLHRQTNRFNIDLFFECNQWSGEIDNKEPEKCEELSFFPQNSLPKRTIEYIKRVIDLIAKGQFYSELGWKL